MDPVSTAVVVGKIVGLGLAGWKAWEKKGPGEEEVKALTALLDLGATVAGSQRKAEPTLAIRYLALILAAFGEARQRHWAYNETLAPTRSAVSLWDYFTRSPEGRARIKDVNARVLWAISSPIGVGDSDGKAAFELTSTLTGSPLQTPYYQRLWKAFTAPELNEPDMEPPLELTTETRSEFERAFLLAYHEGLATPAGSNLSNYLMGLKEHRARIMRELIAADTYSWRRRHVFGNVESHDALPPMPLEEMYVEPDAERNFVWADLDDSGSSPVLRYIRRHLKTSPIVILLADFGFGKSLTARTLAWQWARNYLQDLDVSTELAYPIFVECKSDFTSHQIDLERAIRRALKRQAKSIGVDLSQDHEAFRLPDSDQKVVFILDGLDEIALTERELEALFDEMKGRSSERHRFLVLSRPEAISSLRSNQKLKDIPRIHLHPFTTKSFDDSPGGQVGMWLERWNHHSNSAPISAEQVAARGLLEIAETPILLFMIAHTWKHFVQGDTPVSHAMLYRLFFQQIAGGKHEQDRAGKHPQVWDAAESLKKVLIRMGELESAATAPDAMLWLMARIVWEARRLRQKGIALTAYEIEKLIREELNLRDSADVAKSIQIGLLLSLQTDLENNQGRMLFGHRSFEEFLTACYWEACLRKLVRASDREWDRVRQGVEKGLTGARLLNDSDRCFEFLIQLINQWPEEERLRLVDWANDCFNDERVDPSVSSYAEDLRPYLREAALAVGSSVAGSPGLTANHSTSLRSLLAWFYLHSYEPTPIIIAPGLKHKEAKLAGSVLSEAKLAGAVFSHADLRFAKFPDADLMGAKLERADLTGANFNGAKLRNAILTGADLTRATFYEGSNQFSDEGGHFRDDADLTGANLQEAELNGTKFRRTVLTNADLTGVSLRNATFTHCTFKDIKGVSEEQLALMRGQTDSPPTRGPLSGEARDEDPEAEDE